MACLLAFTSTKLFLCIILCEFLPSKQDLNVDKIREICCNIIYKSTPICFTSKKIWMKFSKYFFLHEQLQLIVICCLSMKKLVSLMKWQRFFLLLSYSCWWWRFPSCTSIDEKDQKTVNCWSLWFHTGLWLLSQHKTTWGWGRSWSTNNPNFPKPN